MANPITTLAGNVIATFQDRDAVLLYVVSFHGDSAVFAASLTTSDLATLDEIEVQVGSSAEMLALLVSKIEAAHVAAPVAATR